MVPAPLKINILLPHLRIAGGVRIALMYANLLQKRGHNVCVYVRSTHPIRRTIANIFRLGYPSWIPDFKASVVRVPLLEGRYIRNADVTIATTGDTALLLETFSESKGTPFYLLQHDEGLYHMPRETADAAYQTRARKIVVSTWLKDVLKNEHDQDSVLLLNPLDLEQFKRVSVERTDATIRVLLLHHVYDWKGTKEGVEVVRALKARHPEVRLIMFGVRQKEGIEFPYDEYHFNVPQEELSRLYSGADIYLCPSWYEGFGLPSIEAMACGLPLVTYDNGGSRDYAFHEKTALVAKNQDTEDLAKQLERCIVDPELRKNLAAAGKKFVQSLPGWEERTIELERILRERP